MDTLFFYMAVVGGTFLAIQTLMLILGIGVDADVDSDFDIDADHVVALGGEMPPETARTTAGVEDPRRSWRHCIDQAGLPGEIGTLRSHLPEPLDIPRRMVRVLRV